ncbi:MAG TPA: hypothetical protein VKZ53_21020 [Candidatus Angelobacter sp.]|nr:hypothetical protein [Candidatus Angelobacter sp.]
MSNTDLSSLLPVSNGTLSIDGNSAPGTVLADQLVRLTNGTPIAVHNAARTATATAVTVTGKASFMNVVDMTVTVTATSGAAGPVVTARFTLIDGQPTQNSWRFSRSFRALPSFNGIKMGGEAAQSATSGPGLLDTLVLADAAFILTTDKTGTDPVTGAPYQEGFNFVARCTPTGLLGLLGSVMTGGGPVLLYGPIHIPKATELTVPIPAMPLMKYPWQMPQLPPGLHLTADLGIDHKLGSALRLHQVGLRIYSPPSTTWADANPTFIPVLAASAKLDIPSASISADITIAGLNSPDHLSIFGLFEGVSVGKLAHLVDLAGQDDLTASLPTDVQKALSTLSKLSLEAIFIQLGVGLSLESAGIAIGMEGLNTTVLPGFTVTKLLANFSVSQPFAPTRSLEVDLGGSINFVGAPFDVNLQLPDVIATARLTSNTTLSLDAVFHELGLPAPPSLTISQMQLGIGKDGSYSIASTMADKPAWTLDLGPVPLTISNVTVLANHPASGTVSGAFSGIISLGDELDLAFSYQTPGDFVMRSDLPEVRLSELIGKMANQKVSLPGDFDLDFVDGSVLIQKSGANLVFQFATTMQDLGTVAFEARKTGTGSSAWGFAAGIDMTGLHLSSIPGLSALKAFDIFTLDELLIVVSSFADPGFKFPALAAFSSPTLRTGDLKLPSQAGGVIAGLNIYARWTLDNSRQQKLLQKFLGLEPSLGITLQVGANPEKDSRLYVSYSTTIQGMPLSCMFGGQISSGEVGLFLTGRLLAKIQQHPCQFDLTLLFVANGAFISGSMAGSITFEGITLSNLALVVGIDWEGIPSLGIAATLTVSHFQSSLAVFFDSTDPAKSMLAGSVSSLSMKDVVDTFAKPKLPSEIDAVLTKVALTGTSEFTIGADLASALDNLQVDLVSAAFSKAGVTLPTTSSEVLLVVGKAGQTWFLTNLANMLHYELVKSASGIKVTLNPQLYCAPQATYLGALQYPQGFFVNTGLHVLLFQGEAKILVMPSQGVSVDGSMNRIVIGTESLFSIESADGKKGPRVSAATFNQPTMTDPVLRKPHFLIDGQINILGLKRETFISLSTSGFAIELAGTYLPGFTYDIKGHFDGPSNMGVSGSLHIGVGNVDLGPLGTIKIDTGASGTLDLGVKGSSIWAKFSAGVVLACEKLNLPNIDLDTNTHSLAELPKKVFDLVVEALKNFLKDPAKWAKFLRAGIITGIQDVGKVLKSVYNLTEQQAAQAMKAAGYVAHEVANALKSGWNSTAQQATQILKGAGYGAHEVGDALKSAYGQTAQQAANLLKGAGYAADQVGDALKSAYGQTADQAAIVLKGAGYGINEVGNALKSAYGATSDVAARALKGAGYAVNETGTFVKNTYNLGADQLNKVLSGVGYAGDQIKGFFNSLGGSFADAFKDVGNKLDPTKW